LFTDYLDNPVNEGDVFVYPVQVGSSSANMNMGRVVTIDPIVPSPQHPGWFCYRSLQLTEHENVCMPEDESKAYRIHFKKLRDGTDEVGYNRIFYIRNVDRVVVVNSLLAS
jgi:hypothetical protein